MISLIRSEIYRIFTRKDLYIAAIMIFCVCWMQYISTENGTLETAASMLFGASLQKCESPINLTAQALIVAFPSSWWFSTVLVAVSSISYSIYVCDERTSGFLRYCFVRISRKEFVVGKLVGATLSAISSIMLGILLFCISVFIFAEPISSVSPDEIMYYFEGNIVNSDGILSFEEYFYLIGTFAKQLFSVLLNATFWSIFAMMIAAVKTNKYFAVILPVILCYIWESAIERDVLLFSEWCVLVASNPSLIAFERYFDKFEIPGALSVCGYFVFMLIRIVAVSGAYCLFSTKGRVDISGER